MFSFCFIFRTVRDFLTYLWCIVPFFFFFFNDPPPPEIYTLSLHDALPIYRPRPGRCRGSRPSPAPSCPPARGPRSVLPPPVRSPALCATLDLHHLLYRSARVLSNARVTRRRIQ